MRVVSLKTWALAEPVLEYSVWGSNMSHVRRWAIGERVIILVGVTGVITGLVSGQAQSDNRAIWQNDLFEWRVPMSGVHRHAGAEGARLNALVRSVLLKRVGSIYGYLLHNQSELPVSISKELEEGLG